MFKTWEDAANYCEDTFGVYIDWEERFFHCPECDEPLCSVDWDEYDWSACPVCGCIFEEN